MLITQTPWEAFQTAMRKYFKIREHETKIAALQWMTSSEIKS